jgi:hypothetical protein
MSKYKFGNASVGCDTHLHQRFCNGKEIAPRYANSDQTMSFAHKVFEACHEAGLAGYRAVSIYHDGKDSVYVFHNGDWHPATWSHGKWGKLHANQPASIRFQHPQKD